MWLPERHMDWLDRQSGRFAVMIHLCGFNLIEFKLVVQILYVRTNWAINITVRVSTLAVVFTEIDSESG